VVFLLVSERRFQHTKERGIWLLNAKVMKEQSLVQKQFLPHRYAIDLEMYSTKSEDGGLG